MGSHASNEVHGKALEATKISSSQVQKNLYIQTKVQMDAHSHLSFLFTEDKNLFHIINIHLKSQDPCTYDCKIPACLQFLLLSCRPNDGFLDTCINNT